MVESDRSFAGANRGASETAGAALLIGLVAFAALATLVIGGGALDGVQAQSDERQASTILQELDSRFSSLSSSSDAPGMVFDLGETNPDDFTLSRDSWVNVSVNKNPTCTANISMSSVRFENTNGNSVGYEAGGVWRDDAAGGSSMITSPSITYNAGTIDVHVVNATGNVDQSKNVARYLVSRSNTRSTKLSDRVFSPGCVRPDNVTLKVTSRYYVAWGDYLASEFEGTVETFEANQTARVFIPQSALPERVDDSKNNVINLTDGNSINAVDVLPSDSDPESIAVDKGASNVYSVSIQPLNDGGLDIGTITDIEEDTNATRAPLDVMFVMDESGSMGSTDGDGTTRMEEAQDAAKGFLGKLNRSMDRAGAVSFENGADYRITQGGTGHYITGDFDELNTTIEGITDGGGTESQYGVEYANNVLELRSNETRDKVMVLLTDGVNDDCQVSTNPMVPETNNDDPFDCRSWYSDNKQTATRADEAKANGVTIYTVGYGDDSYIDEGFLEEIAERTGGSYYQATNSSELDSVFDDIVKEIARTKNIALTPVSANYTSGGGSVYAPQAAGNNDHVARYNINGTDFANINDPTAGSLFTHSFAIGDGESVEMKAYDFKCNEWATTGRTRSHGGDIYNVVRCIDIEKDGTHHPDGFYTDGERIDHLLSEDEAWWQDDINDTFDANPDIGVNRTAGPNFGRLDLESNQALVYWDMPDSGDAENRLLMLYEIGLSESEAESSGIINLEVSTIEIGS